MSASGATISGNVGAGSLSAGSVKISQNQIKIGGATLTGGDKGLIVDPYIFSGTVAASSLEVTNSASFPSGTSVYIGEQSLKGYIQDLIGTALENFKVPNHQHEVSVTSYQDAFKHGGHGKDGTGYALSGILAMGGYTTSTSQGGYG